MLMAYYRTYSALVSELNNRVGIAVKNVAIIVCDKLHDCIDEQYYQDPEFYPNVYRRTETFLNSAMYEMLNNNSAVIGIDTDSMHYRNGFSAKQIVNWAAESMHGSPLYKTSTESFWDSFIEWADENIPILLRDELRNQGLQMK